MTQAAKTGRQANGSLARFAGCRRIETPAPRPPATLLFPIPKPVGTSGLADLVFGGMAIAVAQPGGDTHPQGGRFCCRRWTSCRS